MSECSVETKETIKEYLAAFSIIQQSLLELKKKSPAAKFIQTPKLSAAITESLAHHLIAEHTLIPQLTGFHLVGRGDLIYEKESGGRITLQVKSTGRQAFSKTSIKDLDADYLVWLDMSGIVAPIGRIRSLEVHILPNPGTVLPEPKHIRLKEFLPLPGVKSKKFITSSKFFTPECY